MTNYFEMEPMKYWAMNSSYSPEQRRKHLDQMIRGGNYIYSLKTDGNWSRAVVTPTRNALQTRGISKVTGTYGEVQDRVLFWDDVVKAFADTTVFIGEIYLEGGIDRNVGSILRALPHKSLSIQDKNYYEEAKKAIKFSAKDKRDVEGNEFRNVPLKLRIFDVLCYEGEEIQSLPITERIKYIKKVVDKINSPLVSAVQYYEMENDFYDKIQDIFSAGGEGVVLYNKAMTYDAGKRTAWQTCKVKQEITNLIDCFIIGLDSPTKDYNGKEIPTWQYWVNIRTGEKLCGDYYIAYTRGETLEPITKNYYYGYPGAMRVGVYDKDGRIVTLCSVAGLTDDLKKELRDNYEKWHMTPVTIGGMMISEANGISVRHPYLNSIRTNDIEVKDCTLDKIISEE